MAKKKNQPKWFRKRVFEINLKLINECSMSWDEVLDFWDEVILEARARLQEQNDPCTGYSAEKCGNMIRESFVDLCPKCNKAV